MSATSLTDTRRLLETRLIEKAWKDLEFRKDVVRDGKGMLEKYLGQKLPDQLKVFIHEEDANTLHFSVPPSPGNISELSDEELEKVAGGTETIFLAAIAIPVAVSVGVASGVGAAAGVTKTQGGW